MSGGAAAAVRVRPWYRSERTLFVAATAVALLPLLVSIPRVLVQDVFAINGDDALIELMVRDVGDRTPLVGSYSRFGWNQPGPLLFYILAAPYRLLGSRFAGLQVGALVLNAAAVVAISLIIVRRGGAAVLLWGLLLVAVLAWGLGPGPISDPWEPHVSILPTALLVLLAFDVAAGGAWSLPVAAGVASVLAQAYAAHAAVAAALLAWAAAALAVRAVVERRRPVGRGGVRLLAVVATTLGVMAVLWVPPVVEQLREDPGNLTEMWRFAREPHDTLGMGDAWRAVSLQFDHRAPWLGIDRPLVPLTSTVDVDAAPVVPWALLALAAGLGVAAWRRDRSVLLGLTVLVAVAAVTVSLARLVPPLFPWILEPSRALGFGCWLAAGWCAHRSLAAGVRARLDRFLLPVLGAALLAVSTAAVVDAARHDAADDPVRRALLEVADAGVAVGRNADGPVLLRSTARSDEMVFGEGIGVELLALALERSGVEVVVDEDAGHRFGEHRAAPGRGVLELRLVDGRPEGEELEGFERITTVDPLASGQRARRARLFDELEARLGREDRTLVELQRDIQRDPEVRRLVQEYEAIPDLPLLSLLVRPLP